MTEGQIVMINMKDMDMPDAQATITDLSRRDVRVLVLTGYFAGTEIRVESEDVK